MYVNKTINNFGIYIAYIDNKCNQLVPSDAESIISSISTSRRAVMYSYGGADLLRPYSSPKKSLLADGVMDDVLWMLPRCM